MNKLFCNHSRWGRWKGNDSENSLFLFFCVCVMVEHKRLRGEASNPLAGVEKFSHLIKFLSTVSLTFLSASEWNVNSNDFPRAIVKIYLISTQPFILSVILPFSFAARGIVQNLIKKRYERGKSDYSNEVRRLMLNCDFWFRNQERKRKKSVTESFATKIFSMFTDIKISYISRSLSFNLCWFRWIYFPHLRRLKYWRNKFSTMMKKMWSREG